MAISYRRLMKTPQVMLFLTGVFWSGVFFYGVYLLPYGNQQPSYTPTARPSAVPYDPYNPGPYNRYIAKLTDWLNSTGYQPQTNQHAGQSYMLVGGVIAVIAFLATYYFYRKESIKS
jgi:hypothetical protein